MKILSCHLENFASYKTLDFNFQDQGLTLIQGATGSGKSTLCDAIPWILFGKTAKDGAADEVLSWNGGVATGWLDMDIKGEDVRIVRMRGPKANDLFWVLHEEFGQLKRGKDIPDTQRLINELLGFDSTLFLSGAYFHEFSQTAQFFITTAKNRRAITEQLVDLSLPKKLQEKTSAELKSAKHRLADIELNTSYLSDRVERAEKTYSFESDRAKNWASDIEEQTARLKKLSKNFIQIKNQRLSDLRSELAGIPILNVSEINAQVEDLLATIPPNSEPCKECGQSLPNECKERSLEEITRLTDLVKEARFHDRERVKLLAHITSVENELDSAEYKIQTLKDQTNPHTDLAKEIKEEKDKALSELDKITNEKASLQTKASDLDILSDVIAEFRGILIKNTILDIEGKTNTLLHNHFDAEIRIELMIEDADKLDVVIYKDGNLASYTQLSKGQRQILKLCFGVAVMKAVSNHSGVNFEQVFFDESLDGLDDSFKIKAYSLLQTLALDYNSVFVVEHNESLKALFDNKITISLINGSSQIEQD